VQTIVPVMLDHVNAGRLTLERLVDLMGAGPARVFGLLRKGRLACGYDGDLTLVDMKTSRTIEAAKMASPCGWTPFDGMQVTGWPVATVVRGQVAMREDAVIGVPIGRPAIFEETRC
jgi:dihydroorotase